MVAKFVMAGGSVQVKQAIAHVCLYIVIVFSFFSFFTTTRSVCVCGGGVPDNRCESPFSPLSPCPLARPEAPAW